MSNRSKTCPQCLKPTTTASSGSLTQWIVVCACDLTADPEKTPLEIRLCKRCGKRVEQGRAGSFTQFIFRADLCSCDKPEFFSAYPQAQPLSVDPIHKDESPDDEGLVLSDAKFPVDRYKPIRLLGEGRGGSVYLCRDRLLDKLVAVKTLNHLNDGELVSFHEEARVLSRLEHRSIIKILDFGASESGVPFMVLELGRGITLSEQLKKKGTLGVKEALDLFGELARALAYSHGKGVFHRDLKPENILLTDPGTDDSPVRLLDFGVAMVDFEDWQSVEIDGRTVVGTPAYMSPDVVNGLEFDARSEVYCLGCVLYEALIGKPPFSASTSLETILEHVDKPFPQPEEFDRLPQALVQLLAGCLVKDPEERFQSMEELATSLANISLSADDRDKTSVPLTGRMSYRSPLFAVGMLLFLTTFTCIAFSFFSFNQSEPFRSARQSPKLAYSESRARKSPMLVEQLSSRAKLKNRIRVSGTIDRQDLKRLAANKNIQSLTFDSTADVDWSGLVFFKDSNLEILSLKRTSFSDKDMQYILPLPEKTSIWFSLGVTDKGVETLLQKKVIRHLWLTETNVTGKCLRLISNRSDVEDLDLEAIKELRFEDLELLRKMPSLRRLDVSSMPLGDAAMEIVKQLKLDSLSVDDTNITDRGIRSLSHLNLRFFSIANNPALTDNCLASILGMPNLAILDLSDCPGISRKGLVRLRSRDGLEVLSKSRLPKANRAVEELIEMTQ